MKSAACLDQFRRAEARTIIIVHGTDSFDLLLGENQGDGSRQPIDARISRRNAGREGVTNSNRRVQKSSEKSKLSAMRFTESKIENRTSSFKTLPRILCVPESFANPSLLLDMLIAENQEVCHHWLWRALPLRSERRRQWPVEVWLIGRHDLGDRERVESADELRVPGLMCADITGFV